MRLPSFRHAPPGRAGLRTRAAAGVSWETVKAVERVSLGIRRVPLAIEPGPGNLPRLLGADGEVGA